MYEAVRLSVAMLMDGHPEKTFASIGVERPSQATDCNLKYDVTAECVKRSSDTSPALTTAVVTVKKSERLDLDRTKFVTTAGGTTAPTWTVTQHVEIMSVKTHETNGASLAVGAGYY